MEVYTDVVQYALHTAFMIEMIFIFVDFYRRINAGESLTNLIKPKGLNVKLVSESPVFTHR